MNKTLTVGVWTWRVREGVVERRRHDEPWERVPRRELLELDVDGKVWAWLRELGFVKRQFQSGPTTPEADRGSVQLKVRISEASRKRLDQLAGRWECTLSEAVEKMIKEST